MKCLFSVAAAAVILQGAGLARAAEEASEPTPAQVRSAAEAFDRGREAYKSEDYVEAAEQFESADSNAPSSAALELAIRARDKAGQLDRAATLAALALARHPGDPNIQKIAPAIVQRAKADLFEIDLKCDDPCDVTVAGKITPGLRATEHTVFVQPGTYAVRAGWSGERSLSKSIEASKGAAGTLEFQAPALRVAPPPVAAPAITADNDKSGDQGTQHKSGALPPTVFWVGVGLTAVATGVTIWSGLDTQNNPGRDKVRDACNAMPPTDCNSLYDQGRSKQTRTNVLIGVTSGVGVATAVIGAFFTDWSGGSKAAAKSEASRAQSRFSVQPWLAIGSGASVGALGRF
jgi:hypothetical protein